MHNVLGFVAIISQQFDKNDTKIEFIITEIIKRFFI